MTVLDAVGLFVVVVVAGGGSVAEERTRVAVT